MVSCHLQVFHTGNARDAKHTNLAFTCHLFCCTDIFLISTKGDPSLWRTGIQAHSVTYLYILDAEADKTRNDVFDLSSGILKIYCIATIAYSYV